MAKFNRKVIVTDRVAVSQCTEWYHRRVPFLGSLKQIKNLQRILLFFSPTLLRCDCSRLGFGLKETVVAAPLADWGQRLLGCRD